MIRHICKQLFIPLVLLGAAPGAKAQDKEPEIDYGENMRDCINLRKMQRTRVIDDLNVLFYMRGSTVYHNILPRQCTGLARHDRFSYKSSAGQLCRTNRISILYNDAFGLSEGNSCSLGAFHEISNEDAKAFTENRRERRAEPKPLPMPTPQKIGENGGEKDEVE